MGAAGRIGIPASAPNAFHGSHSVGPFASLARGTRENRVHTGAMRAYDLHLCHAELPGLASLLTRAAVLSARHMCAPRAMRPFAQVLLTLLTCPSLCPS